VLRHPAVPILMALSGAAGSDRRSQLRGHRVAPTLRPDKMAA
jgi:hypothetical protein